MKKKEREDAIQQEDERQAEWNAFLEEQRNVWNEE